MSLHIEISEDAQRALDAQKRNSTIAAALIAVLSLVLIGLILTLFFIELEKKKPDVMQAVEFSQNVEKTIEKKKVQTTKRPPSSSAASSSKVITSNAVSPVSIAIPKVDIPDPSAEFGDGEFGAGGGFDGNGDGVGATGGGSIFGSNSPVSGALTGSLYDFKQDEKKVKVKDYTPGAYMDIVQKIHRRDFSDAALSKFYKAPYELSISHFAIPFLSATLGPKHFGAEKEMEPSGWMAHYNGTITAPEDGKFRFVGMGDDYMTVFVKGRPELVACWPDIQERVSGDVRWKGAKENRTWKSPIGAEQTLYVGDWIKMSKGEEFKLDIAIGERPGGMMGYILMIEKEGQEYRKDESGRPILPLFTTREFDPKSIEEIKKAFGSYEFEWQKVPVFSAK